MSAYINAIYKHQKKFLVLFILMNLLALYGLFQLKIETSFDVFKVSNSAYLENFNILEEQFPTSDQTIVMIENASESRSEIEQFEADIAALEGVSFVKGLSTESELPINMGTALSPIKTIDGVDYGIITIFPNQSFDFDDLKQIERLLEDHHLTYYMSGNAYMQNKIFDYLLLILLFIPPSALFILFNIFRLQMRSVKGTLLSIMPAGIAALWTLGFVGLMGNQVSVLTVLAPIFTIIIGSADGLHFISHIQEHLEDGHDMRDSLTYALSMVGIPMVITTVTSVAGFVSLMFMNTAAIHDLALYASLGIALAGVATWLIIPLINSFEHLDIRKKATGKHLDFPFRKIWGVPSLVISALIILISIFGLPLINTEFNQLMMYKDSTDVSKSFEKIMKINEGTIPIFALIPHNGDPFDPAVSAKVNAYTDALEADKHISKTLSIHKIIKTIIPDSMDAARLPQLLQALQSQSVYKELVSDDYIKVIIFPMDLNNETIEKLIALTNDADIKLAGTQLMMYELNQNMISGQGISLGIAFGLVFLSLLLSLKRFAPSLIAMVPILVTTLFLFAFLGFSGISLNLFTATLFSITIGVGIDYAIHFTSIYQGFRTKGVSCNEAADRAYGFSARPIIANALGFSIGLTVLMLSPLKVHFYVSSLMWVSMILSGFLSLTLLPTLLKRFN